MLTDSCHRVQCKDLVESSAQRASSVSPAHFRSALSRARRILATAKLSSPSPPRRSSRSTSTSENPSPPKQPAALVISPFQTPKKRFKFSSGIDLSGLVRSPHEPATSRPVKHSVTPSASRWRTRDEEEGEEEEEGGAGGEEAEVRTPTKRVKYATRPGVDLEAMVETSRLPLVEERSAKRKREDASAFYALRPGSGSASTSTTPVGGKQRHLSPTMEDGLPEIKRSHVMRDGARMRKEKPPRRDWTYGEAIWGGPSIVQTNEAILEKVRDIPV